MYAPQEFEGAPWHPHRGFDTVMYLKAGEGKHQDSTGNSGIVRAGEVQWMSAASGIIHDEGREHPGGLLHGFQLWVNLPAKNKMDPPSYQQLKRETFTQHTVAPGVKVKIIAGKIEGVGSSPFALKMPVLYADVEAEPNASAFIPIGKELETAFIYMYEGTAAFQDAAKEHKASRKGTIFFNSDGDGIQFTASETGAKFILLCGKPLKEPIARHGPFVMNTQAEIRQAFQDYEAGKFVKHTAKMQQF
jgi:redox-sensitive bicupin YhaK (pirin superfamily)